MAWRLAKAVSMIVWCWWPVEGRGRREKVRRWEKAEEGERRPRKVGEGRGR